MHNARDFFDVSRKPEIDPEVEVSMNFENPEEAKKAADGINLNFVNCSFRDNPDDMPEEFRVAKVNPDNLSQIRLAKTELIPMTLSMALNIMKQYANNQHLKEEYRLPKFTQCVHEVCNTEPTANLEG